MEKDVAFDPMDVGFFGADGVVFAANGVAHVGTSQCKPGPGVSWPCFGLLAEVDFGPMVSDSVSSCEPRLLPQKGRDMDIMQ